MICAELAVFLDCLDVRYKKVRGYILLG